jgi:hypothetical protein
MWAALSTERFGEVFSEATPEVADVSASDGNLLSPGELSKKFHTGDSRGSNYSSVSPYLHYE